MPRDTTRRSPLEFINAMANLHRRAGQRRAALRHYHDQLKRRLGRRYRLDPSLHDAEYVTRLFLVFWEDGDAFRRELDDRVPYLELGSL